MNQLFTIKDLKEGKCAIINDGTVEKLNRVLNAAFPEDDAALFGGFPFYTKNINNALWIGLNTTILPTQSVKDFIKQLDMGTFILPEKWRVKDCKEVTKYAKSRFQPGIVDMNIYNRFLCIDESLNDYWFYDIDSYILKSYTEITFEQFKQYVLKEEPTQKETFPKDNFSIIVENNAKEIVEYLVNKGFNNIYNMRGNNLAEHYQVHNGNIDTGHNPQNPKYTLQQLKNLDTMEKKQIGWKMIKTQFYGVACVIVKCEFSLEVNLTYKGCPNWIDRLKEAGVLELWFEPVFEEVPQFKVGDYIIDPTAKIPQADKIVEILNNYYKSNKIVKGMACGFKRDNPHLRLATPQEIKAITIKVIRLGGENGFDLTVKDGKVFHKSEEITPFITDMKIWSENQLIKQKQFGKYSAIIEDIVFSKTGCENKPTKLSEWLAVAKLIN